MINSPSLSLTPTAQSVARSGANKAPGEGSFATHMEQVQSAQHAPNQRPSTLEQESRTSSKPVTNDREQPSEPAENGSNTRLNDRQTTSTAQAESSKDASKETADGQDSASSAEKMTPDGKEGQSLAGQGKGSETQADAEVTDNAKTNLKAEADSETSESDLAATTDAKAQTQETDVATETKSSDALADAAQDSTTKTEQVSEEGESLKAQPVATEQEADATQADKAPNAQSEDADSAVSEAEDLQASVDASTTVSQATPSADAEAAGVAAAQAAESSQAAMQAGVGVQKAGSQTGIVDDAVAPANVTTTVSPSVAAAGAEAKPAETNNLRWVMDQMSLKGDKANLAQTFAQANAEAVKVDLNLPVKDAVLMAEGEMLQEDFSLLANGKKSLDQLMSSLGSQLPNTSQTGMNNAAANAAVLATPTAQAAVPTRADASAPQLTMQTMPNSAAWTAEMTTKVSWVAKEGFKTAHIQLDPPELGSLTVKVSMDQDSNTQVSFIASSAQARDALEGQMQRLRDMLAQQGVDVESVDVEVSQGNDQSTAQEQLQGEGGTGQRGTGEMLSDAELDESLENVAHIATPERGIDFYA
ncbi:flagellar hook-length control protein FliK [Marinomonas ostreistagni]|uniref:flagellar hook-length control protein FliK n=1 Tax=Marinomonas ostreistagni TaxID=359209 RepID=UPI00195165AE|nr:flagellar hook-length control protein FliK [Marinomonas ostreistagni]MBM6551251.1 flagellar hook-length control protein FliK [Marinomonas ostreistagni]